LTVPSHILPSGDEALSEHRFVPSAQRGPKFRSPHDELFVGQLPRPDTGGVHASPLVQERKKRLQIHTLLEPLALNLLGQSIDAGSSR